MIKHEKPGSFVVALAANPPSLVGTSPAEAACSGADGEIFFESNRSGGKRAYSMGSEGSSSRA